MPFPPTPANTRPDWAKELGFALRTAQDLWREGLIEENQIAAFEKLLATYKFLLPRYYAGLIARNDPQCPIRLQSLPDLRELENGPGMKADPLDDLQFRPTPKITHRFTNRLLLHLTPNCSMYCRFCFRKSLLNDLAEEFFSGENEASLRYIAEHTEVEEVIFSGGDPFMLSDSTLKEWVGRLSFLSHLKRLRFHTRVPVTFPMRITQELVRAIHSPRQETVVVTHFNHPREITGESTLGIKQLQGAGYRVLNQSVLLTGVNDCAKTLAQLIEHLDAIGVSPYYIHHPDRAAGTSHFDLTFQRGLQIYDELKSKVPAYLLPRYVVDTGSTEGKIPVS